MTSRFEERLRTGPAIVGDGGMGALVSSAVQRLRCPEEANIRAPEAVVSLHVSFINAGAELIETNTFGAGRPKLAALYLEDEFERINSQAVRLAREAREIAGRKEVFIGGSIGPLGDRDDSSRRSGATLFAEQARILQGRGADLFLVETFFDLDELCSRDRGGPQHLEPARRRDADLRRGRPDGSRGVSAPEAAERLADATASPRSARTTARGSSRRSRRSRGWRRRHPPLAVMPNIGLASLAGGRVVYPHATPEYFAEFAAHARDLGAGLIGGCCGTTPTEIAAIALGGRRGAPAARTRSIFAERDARRAVAGPAGADPARAALSARANGCVSVQIDPPLGGNSAGCSRRRASSTTPAPSASSTSTTTRWPAPG